MKIKNETPDEQIENLLHLYEGMRKLLVKVHDEAYQRVHAVSFQCMLCGRVTPDKFSGWQHSDDCPLKDYGMTQVTNVAIISPIKRQLEERKRKTIIGRRKCVYLDNGHYHISKATAKSLCPDNKLPRPGYETLADSNMIPTAEGQVWVSRTTHNGKQIWTIRDAK